MADYYIGEIITSAINFAPREFLPCDGRLLSISTNTALFSLLGTNFGGNGSTTFGLPDLRGRAVVAMGQGPGLTGRSIGSTFGQETVPLTAAQLPAHTHTLVASSQAGTAASPVGNYFGASASGQSAAAPLSAAPDPHYASTAMLGNAGSGQPHENVQPSLVIGYYICVQGLYPPRW
ncbi:MAG: phage tail protein [Phycisphaeraceae bacterium]|nr:phage tail protein [Phycisphaeraceae bacterium]